MAVQSEPEQDKSIKKETLSVASAQSFFWLLVLSPMVEPGELVDLLPNRIPHKRERRRGRIFFNFKERKKYSGCLRGNPHQARGQKDAP